MAAKSADALGGQAQTLVDAASAAANWFRRPGPQPLSAARTARLRSRSWREAAVAALKDGHGPAKNDQADRSFSLREAVENAVQAVADAAQWEMGADAALAALAESLGDGAQALMHAAKVSGPARHEAIVLAKSHAAAVERGRREILEEAQQTTFFVEAIKRGEIAARFSAAAEALQQAGDAFEGGLSE